MLLLKKRSDNMNITFRPLRDEESEYIKLQKWCSKKYVYEWFEQRILSLDEIRNKYKNKLKNNKQELLIIQENNTDIGLVQIYKYEDSLSIKELNKYKNIYEYDLFIGIESYLNKGLGKEIINLVNKRIYSKYKADSIILRPFKRNIRAIKCYEKSGFKLVNEYQGKDTLGNPEIISVLLNEVKK